MDLMKHMKKILFIEICLGIILCSCSMTKHDGKTCIKWPNPKETDIVMVGRMNEFQVLGRDLDGDHQVDLIEYYNCDSLAVPYSQDTHGGYHFNNIAKCKKVGFAVWQ